MWGKAQQVAFDKLKKLLSAYPIVKIFDPAKDTTLTTDASEVSISAIMTQDGHPIMYLSRKLSASERKYSNIEREALAIVWAVQRAKHFLLGKKFTLQSDHKLLEFIFNPRKEIPKVISAHLMRWALSLSAFDYEIEYIKGENIPHVDALSHLDFDAASDADNANDVGDEEEGTFVHWAEMDIASLEEVKLETGREHLLMDIVRRVETNKWSACSVAERPFKAVRQSLSVENGVLCKGDTLVPPTTLRKKILSSVHDDVHCGTAATRNRLRLEVWWPGYCSDVETYVKKCSKCAEIKSSSKR